MLNNKRAQRKNVNGKSIIKWQYQKLLHIIRLKTTLAFMTFPYEETH